MATNSLPPSLDLTQSSEEKKVSDFQITCQVPRNKEAKFDDIDKIKILFERLKNTPTSQNNDSPESILHDLSNICSQVDSNKYSSMSHALDILDVITKTYIKFLDTDLFVTKIAQRYSKANNNFLRSLLSIVNQYDFYIWSYNITDETRQQMLYSLFDALSSSTRICAFLQNKDSVNQTIPNACGSVIYVILRILNNLNGKIKGKDLEKYQRTIFTPFITFLDDYFMNKKCSKSKQQQNDLLIEAILSFLWNVADKTSTIPIYINADCPKACLRWISLSYLNIHEYRKMISILHNMARHDEAATILNKNECPKILNQFKRQILDERIDFIIEKSLYIEIKILFYMTLALVMDPDELRGDVVNNNIISQLLSMTISASKASKFRYDGFHISEPLIVLMKLCVNDDIIRFILQKKETLTTFCDMLGTFLTVIKDKRVGDVDIDLDVLTIMALGNILWSISFHDRYKAELHKNIELINRLEKFHATGISDKVLADNFIPYRMSSLKKAIYGIRESVFPSKREIKPSVQNKTIRSLMISYSHANTPFCRQLYDMLSKDPTLSVWVDFNGYKSRDLWEEIARAIEQSDYVLFLMSKDYFNSKSCRQEVAYVTDTLKKEFIPIYVDTDFKASGWLGIRIAGSQYIRFGKNDFSNTYKELLSIINKTQPIVIPVHHIPSPLPNKPSSDVKNWTEKEITKWFNDNNIMPELCQFYKFQNGNELLLYSEAMHTLSWLKEYENVQIKFAEKFKDSNHRLSTHEFIKFVNALKILQNK